VGVARPAGTMGMWEVRQNTAWPREGDTPFAALRACHPNSRTRSRQAWACHLVVWNTQNDGSGATAGLSSSAENTVGQANRGAHQNGCSRVLGSRYPAFFITAPALLSSICTIFHVAILRFSARFPQDSARASSREVVLPFALALSSEGQHSLLGGARTAGTSND